MDTEQGLVFFWKKTTGLCTATVFDIHLITHTHKALRSQQVRGIANLGLGNRKQDVRAENGKSRSPAGPGERSARGGGSGGESGKDSTPSSNVTCHY